MCVYLLYNSTGRGVTYVRLCLPSVYSVLSFLHSGASTQEVVNEGVLCYAGPFKWFCLASGVQSVNSAVCKVKHRNNNCVNLNNMIYTQTRTHSP